MYHGEEKYSPIKLVANRDRAVQMGLENESDVTSLDRYYSSQEIHNLDKVDKMRQTVDCSDWTYVVMDMNRDPLAILNIH